MKFDDAYKIFSMIKEDETFYIKFKSNIEKQLSSLGKSSGHIITKVTEKMLTRYNSYEEQPTVQQMVENGYQISHKRRWGEWDKELKDVVNHNGKRYLRMYYPNDKKTVGKVNENETHWFIDGVEVDEQTVINSGFIQNSYWKAPNQNCVEIDVENILAIEP